jgi:CheY-like chemotaxis protein
VALVLRGPAGRRPGVTRPVLLSVDDDPSVSRAVARDLRRRYNADYRVVRAESGPEALEALRQLTVRGEPTALLLADHRMPGMTGVDFLEQAMDLAPAAKRVLLTAYADTDAAIRAINEIDLDRYLLKPWDPPEELLYPILDDLLDSWRKGRAQPSKVSPWSGTSGPRDSDGEGVPRPQPGPLPAPGRAPRGGPAHARGGPTGRRPRAAGGFLRGRHRAAASVHSRARRACRASGDRRQPLLRRGRRRGRTCRAGRRGLRR